MTPENAAGEQNMNQFSIIIPTLNEADNILLLLHHIAKVFASSSLQPEVLVVDDGSIDGTRQLVTDYHGNLNVQLICRDNARGLAGAVVTGAQQATHQKVVVMDADLSHPPAMIPALIEPLLAGMHDMVIGSRYVAGGGTPDWPAARRIGSQLASIPARLLSSVRDPLSGFFAIGRERLINKQENMPGFKIALEILAEGKGSLRVLEVPISFRDRSHGSSKMNFSVLQEYLYQLARLLATRHIIKVMPVLFLLGLTVGLLDYALFSALMQRGWPIETSHMLSLLGALHVCYPLSLLLHWRKPGSSQIGDYFRFLTIVLLGLFIRDGILASPILTNGTSPFLLAGTIVVTSIVIWSAALLCVRLQALDFQAMNWKAFGTLLISYTILLRLVYLGNIELIQEEAYYWNYSRHMAAGYLDHPPVIALLIGLGTEIFGNNEFGVRLGAFLCWFVTAFFSYRLARKIFNSDTAFRAVVLVASLPIFFGVALVNTPDAPLIACWSGALYFFYRALVRQESAAWYGAGISLGIGLAAKYTIILLGPAVILFMLADASARRWFFKPQPYIAALLALAVFSPVIWWNYQQHWVSFLFQSRGRVEDVSKFSTHLLLIGALILLTPTGFLGAATGMLSRRRRFAGKTNPRPGSDGEDSRGFFFCLLMTLVPLSIFILFSLTKEIKLNWTGPIWLATLPFIAFGMARSTGGLQQRIARLWPGTLIAVMIAYGALLHYCTFGLPGTTFAKSPFLNGWDDLARQVNTLVRNATTPLLVVGMDKYKIASGLAFYRNKINGHEESPAAVNDTTGRQLFGENALMYNYWCSPKQAGGRDILVIAEDRKQLDAVNFTDHYQQLGEIKTINIEKRGKSSGHFFYRRLTSYSADMHAHLTISTSPTLYPGKNHDS